MKKFIALTLLLIIAVGIFVSLAEVTFRPSKPEVGGYYVNKGVKDTGAVNIVTSVVLDYRGLDTLGEVTVLFAAALGLGMAASMFERKRAENIPSSLILSTGCRFFLPFILLVGVYIFLHGHLTPGGGFQGGAIIASGFLLVYLGCPGERINKNSAAAVESISGLAFVIIGLLGLCFGGYFLVNFLSYGTPNTLLSAGVIPLVYTAIGFKVGAELSGVINDLMG